MTLASRLLAAFGLGTLAALLCAAAILRRLPADPAAAMTAAGMALTLVWPALVVAACVTERARTAWLLPGGVAVAALALGWALP